MWKYDEENRKEIMYMGDKLNKNTFYHNGKLLIEIYKWIKIPTKISFIIVVMITKPSTTSLS